MGGRAKRCVCTEDNLAVEGVRSGSGRNAIAESGSQSISLAIGVSFCESRCVGVALCRNRDQLEKLQRDLQKLKAEVSSVSAHIAVMRAVTQTKNYRDAEEVNKRLEDKMCEAIDAVLKTATKYKTDLRTAAYIVAINRVATVTRMRGMYA